MAAVLYIDAVERKPLLILDLCRGLRAGREIQLAGASRGRPALDTCHDGRYLPASAAALFDRRTGLIAALLYSVFQPWATVQ